MGESQQLETVQLREGDGPSVRPNEVRAEIHGERFRAERTGTQASSPWTLVWLARGPQASTDVRTAVAQGDQWPVDIDLPPGPPSFEGALVSVQWQLETAGAVVPLHRPPSPVPRVVDTQAWERWRRKRAVGFAAARVLVVGIAVGVVAVVGVLAVGAALLPLSQALLVWAVLALAAVGGVAALRTHGLAVWRPRSSAIRICPGFAVLGGQLCVDVSMNPRQAMAADGYTWRLRCVERAAKRIVTPDRGQERERDEWQVRVVRETQGAVVGPPYGESRFFAEVCADGPATLTAPRREYLWSVHVRCGEDETEELAYVAPFRGG